MYLFDLLEKDWNKHIYQYYIHMFYKYNKLEPKYEVDLYGINQKSWYHYVIKSLL